MDATAFPNAWKQLADGSLLDRMEQDGYEILVTTDKNMPYQQVLTGRRISVVVVSSADRKRISVIAAHLAAIIDDIMIGQFSLLGFDGRLTLGIGTSS